MDHHVYVGLNMENAHEKISFDEKFNIIKATYRVQVVQVFLRKMRVFFASLFEELNCLFMIVRMHFA